MTLRLLPIPLLGFFLAGGCDGNGDKPTDDSGSSADVDADGWTVGAGDCDDADDAVNPAAIDTPRNGIDEDCDGSDSGVVSLATADVRIEGDAAYEFAGSSVATGGDLDGDGVGDLVIGAPAGRDEVPMGQVYVFLGPIQSAVTSTAAARISGVEQYDATGFAVAIVGDVNADGVDDLAIGAPRNSTFAPDGGAVHIFHGPISGSPRADAADTTFRGAFRALAGYAVAGVGDVNNDGLDDLAFGSPHISTEPVPGQVNLWFGPQTDTWEETDVVLTSDHIGDAAGLQVASAGDVNGDGWIDLLVGAPTSGEGGSLVGKVWLAYGPLLASGMLADSAASFVGEADSDYAGNSVASAGDVDGDGRDDLLCGGHLGGERAGKAWLVLGPGTGTYALTDADGRFVGEFAHDFTGWAVGGGLDSGFFAVSAPGDPYYRVSSPGLVYLWNSVPLDPESALVLQGEVAGDGAGGALALDGDVSGDGRPDLVVGAEGAGNRVEGGGAVYVAFAGGPVLGG